MNIISGYNSSKKLRFIILKFKIKLKDATNRALDKISNADILDILDTK